MAVLFTLFYRLKAVEKRDFFLFQNNFAFTVYWNHNALEKMHMVCIWL